MKKSDVFDLWGKVQKGDKSAKKDFIRLYKKEYPNNLDLAEAVEEGTNNYSAYMHIMYSHLYRKAK